MFKFMGPHVYRWRWVYLAVWLLFLAIHLDCLWGHSQMGDWHRPALYLDVVAYNWGVFDALAVRSSIIVGRTLIQFLHLGDVVGLSDWYRTTSELVFIVLWLLGMATAMGMMLGLRPGWMRQLPARQRMGWIRCLAAAWMTAWVVMGWLALLETWVPWRMLLVRLNYRQGEKPWASPYYQWRPPYPMGVPYDHEYFYEDMGVGQYINFNGVPTYYQTTLWMPSWMMLALLFCGILALCFAWFYWRRKNEKSYWQLERTTFLLLMMGLALYIVLWLPWGWVLPVRYAYSSSTYGLGDAWESFETAKFIAESVIIMALGCRVALLFRLKHMLSATQEPVCPACGYDLRGTLAAGRNQCPECGLACASLPAENEIPRSPP